ncbi:MAG: thioesterase family protein [Alphaproteobacteria bacterium]|nr:thioesterase family protein [Alphaproteobacteria bacterium]
MSYKTHKFKFQIAYADTDAGGIAYHARFIEMAERARMDWSRGIKYPDNDLGFVVRQLDIKYSIPLLVGDDIIIETTPISVGAASVKIEQKFLRRGDICAIMHITIAYLGRNMRPQAIPESIVRFFE